MFERFTSSARDAVRSAAGAARAAGTHEIGLDQLVGALLPDPGPVEADLAAARRRAGLSDVDTRALAELGIDVDAVVDAAERELGPGVLTAGPARSGGRLRLSPAARAALVCALKTSRACGDRELRPEHLLLGVLTQRVDRVPADVLAGHGVTTATVLATLEQRRRGAA